MKKGIKLPNREGLWEEVGPHAWQPENHVTYKRLPEPKPMPEIQAGDYCEFEFISGGGNQFVHIVSRHETTFIVLHNGRENSWGSPIPVRIWRQGRLIWKREEA